MRIRLDPPDLGAVQITVRMRDGVMSAEFKRQMIRRQNCSATASANSRRSLRARG